MTDGKGQRIQTITIEGIPTPESGDEYLLFLTPDGPGLAEVFGDKTTHALISVIGIMRVVDGTIFTDYRGSDPVASALDGVAVAELGAVFPDS